jgi:hypothetical protein
MLKITSPLFDVGFLKNEVPTGVKSTNVCYIHPDKIIKLSLWEGEFKQEGLYGTKIRLDDGQEIRSDLEPEEFIKYLNSHKEHALLNIDFKMLRKQKEDLLVLIDSGVAGNCQDSLEGILNLIDHIQDTAVLSGRKNKIVYGY